METIHPTIKKTKVIEFVGQARSGKTTQINLLYEHLITQGYKVALISDRERLKQVHVPLSPLSNPIAFQLVFHAKVIDDYYRYKGKVDFILIDRGFVDVAVWAQVLFTLKKISMQERKALVVCWKKLRKLVDLTLYFQVPLEILFERQKNLKNEPVDEVVLNHTWMGALEKAYQHQKKSFPHLVEIDGTKNIEDAKEMIWKAVEKEL